MAEYELDYSEFIEVNGDRQNIRVRAAKKGLPVVLFLHGGPGVCDRHQIIGNHSALAQKFTLVCWDQRGSGKSYTSALRRQNLSVDTFVSDVEFMLEYLTGKFGVRKVAVVGHSWGSIIGTLAVSRRPDLVSVYIGEGQFEEVFAYDGSIIFDADAEEAQQEELAETVAADERITDSARMLETAVDVEKDGVLKSAYLIVPEQEEELRDYVQLQDRKTREAWELDGDGIIVSEKLASLLGVSEGSTVTLSEDDTGHVEAVVSHVTENYFMHYVYMSRELYEKLYEKEPEWNTLFLHTTQTDEAFEEGIQEDYMGLDADLSVSFISGMAKTVDDMLGSMNVVIAVLVISAGMLAFIVLYNLNNINISERKRELATLKVLGFFDREVSAYVNRENIMLTAIGMAVGLLLGLALHRFVMTTVETDTIMFGRVIRWYSYVFSGLLTIVFSMIVSGVQFFKLKKIDMVESLKSVE